MLKNIIVALICLFGLVLAAPTERSLISHIVLFKIKPNTPPESTAEMLNEIVKLKTTISWVHKVHCGPNFTDRGKGYTHGCVIEIWGPRQYLNEYLTHPDHLALREKYISKIVETDGLLALDYEFPESLTLRR